MQTTTLPADVAAELVDQLGMAALWCRPDGSLYAATSAAPALFGFRTMDDLLAASSSPSTLWDEPVELAAWLTSTTAGSAPARRFGARRPDGSAIAVWLHRSAAPPRDAPDAAIAVLATDATAEARDLARRLQLARCESISAASGAIGHKLNNLLAGLLGYLALLRKAVTDRSPAETVTRYLEALEETGRRVHELTGLLMFVAQRSISFASRPGDVAAVMTGVLGRIPPTIPVAYETPEPLPEAKIDPQLLGEALEQAITGVAGVLPGAKAVSVSLAEEEVSSGLATSLGVAPGPYIVVRIGHKHDPVPPVARERLFDPYFTAQGKGKGAELYLARAWGIMTLHRGTILVTSSGPTDTRLDLFLPASG